MNHNISAGQVDSLLDSPGIPIFCFGTATREPSTILASSLSDEPVHMYKAIPITEGARPFRTVGKKSSSLSRGSNLKWMVAKNGLHIDRRRRLS